MKVTLFYTVMATIVLGTTWAIVEYRNSPIPVTDLDVMKKVEFSKKNGFWVDKYEVTNGQYWRFDKSHQFVESEIDFPVTNITWRQAHDYARSVGKRLPTLQEWQTAATHSTDEDFIPWDALNNFPVAIEPNEEHVYRVGRFWRDRTPLGIANMASNAWEWTADTLRLENGPLVAIVKGGFVKRNGELFYDGITASDTVKIDQKRNNLGFRCVRDLK